MSKRDKGQLELFEEGDVDSNDAVTPRGWASIRLSEIAEVRLGRQRSPERATGDHMRPYMRAANVTWNGISLHDVKQMDFTPREAEIYELRHGDILLAEASGSATEVGKPAIWRDEVPGACFQNTLIRVRAPQEILEFLYYHFLRDAVTGRFAEASRGVGIHHLGAQAMSDWEIVVPPWAEQERIVSAVETQFSRLDAAEAGLRRVQANLKRYRAAVLQAAVEGRLVPTEAELARRERRDYEPASILLDRILDERRRRWEETELARLTARGQPPQNDAWKAKYEKPAAPDTGNLPELPEGWCWASTEQLMTHLTSGSRDWRPYYDKGDSVFILAQNIRPGRLDLTFVQRVDPPLDDPSCIRSRVQQDDILVTIAGANTGDVCRVNSNLLNHYVCQSVALIRFTSDVLPSYVETFLCAPLGQQFYHDYAYGQGRPHLGFEHIRMTPIALPPLPEQKRIAEEAARSFSIIDEIEVVLSLNVNRCQRLRQAILKQAFEGKLVAQDPKDEPASALLARIRGEREAPAPGPTTTTSGRAGNTSSARPAHKRARP